MEFHSGWVDGHLLLVLAQGGKKSARKGGDTFLAHKAETTETFLARI